MYSKDLVSKLPRKQTPWNSHRLTSLVQTYVDYRGSRSRSVYTVPNRYHGNHMRDVSYDRLGMWNEKQVLKLPEKLAK